MIFNLTIKGALAFSRDVLDGKCDIGGFDQRAVDRELLKDLLEDPATFFVIPLGNGKSVTITL